MNRFCFSASSAAVLAVTLALVGGPAAAQHAAPHHPTSAARDADRATAAAATATAATQPDAWVLTKVKTQFAASTTVDATDINVDVRDGVVWLKGTVGSVQEQREAVRLAQATQGVQRVDSSGLTLQPEEREEQPTRR